MRPEFQLYFDGDVQFRDARIEKPVTFAHVSDLHLPPPSPDALRPCYRAAMRWWGVCLGHPREVLPRLLDDICSREPDFVFFGGDNLDGYHPDSAALLVEMCRERGLTAHFQIGNHDWEDERTRYVTHTHTNELRRSMAERLCRDWDMPAPYYAFERDGVRFISLDTIYVRIEGGYAGVFDSDQTDWFVRQLDYEGPIIVFQHVPFSLPTLEHRIRCVLRGVSACIAEDENGKRVRLAIQQCPNVLGMFTGHLHFRSEDSLGSCWQFVAPPAHASEWRYVKIANIAPPKSLRVSGEPTVDAKASLAPATRIRDTFVKDKVKGEFSPPSPTCGSRGKIGWSSGRGSAPPSVPANQQTATDSLIASGTRIGKGSAVHDGVPVDGDDG